MVRFVHPSRRQALLCVSPNRRIYSRYKRFLGGYFRKFVPNYSAIARPLSNLLRANAQFRFNVAEEDTCNRLKTILSKRPVLSLHRINAETELHTDVSKYGYGVMLLQRNSEEQLLHPIYYASGKTTPAKEKYTSYELEVLAIVKALRRFRVYLLGISFKIVADCQAFTLIMAKEDLCASSSMGIAARGIPIHGGTSAREKYETR